MSLHPQFSKDVLVNIYSAYIDNFLNAKDAVRVAKEARPAFLKFLEVLWARAGGWRPPLPWASFGDPGSSQPETGPWTFPSLHVISHTAAYLPCFWISAKHA